MTFEEKMNELEELVKRLESGQTPLEETLKLFERGQLLLKELGEILDSFSSRLGDDQ